MVNGKDIISSAKKIAKTSISNIDVTDIKEKVIAAGEVVTDKAEKVRDAANVIKDDIEFKLTELDRELEKSITDYNDIFTIMNDNGYSLHIERLRSIDLLNNIEQLINSIANHPKSFDTDFEIVNVQKEKFIDNSVFASKELDAARKSVEGAGAGLAAGAAVACMAPTAAMWVATTFGTASTGVAISTLSGAAASNAALAWLGGGALAVGGHGMAAGTALLALSGPIGWGVAGASLLTSIILFSRKKNKLNSEKNSEIESIKNNTESIREINVKLESILSQTESLKQQLTEVYTKSLIMYGKEYYTFDSDQKTQLGAMVNNAKALSALFEQTVC